MVEDSTLFQARKQVFLKRFVKRKFGIHFPPVALRKCLLMLSDTGSWGSSNLHSTSRASFILNLLAVTLLVFILVLYCLYWKYKKAKDFLRDKAGNPERAR